MCELFFENCIENAENRFELIVEASKRARDIASGRVNVPFGKPNDKVTVIALLEAENFYKKNNPKNKNKTL